MPRQGGLPELRLAAGLLLAQATVSSGAYRGQQDDNEIRLLQWNPHWECVAWNEHECGRYAKESLWAELVGHSIDFANIVELGFADRDLPAGWSAIRRKCGVDVIELMYLSHRWKVSDGHGAFASGCMDKHDRPFIVQQFDDVSTSGGGRRVIVVAAHYPHNKDRSGLRDALASVVKATGVQGTILLADTNENFAVSNDKVMRDINAPGKLWVSTDLHSTCCWNNGVDSFAQGNTYDRIIANFGRMVSTTVLPLPVWGRTGEFHRAVRGVLLDAPVEAEGIEVPILRALQGNTTPKAPLRQLGDVTRDASDDAEEARQLALATVQREAAEDLAKKLAEAKALPEEPKRQLQEPRRQLLDVDAKDRQLAMSTGAEDRQLAMSVEQREAAEDVAKKLEEAKAAVDDARLSEAKANDGQKEAERLAEEAEKKSKEAKELNAAAAEEVLVATSALERADELRQEMNDSTEDGIIAKSMTTRLEDEESLANVHQGEANKTQRKATSLKVEAQRLSDRSEYMMKEADDRRKQAKKEIEDAEARMARVKDESQSAQKQADEDFEEALEAKLAATEDAAKAASAMQKAEDLNLKAEREKLNAADKRNKAEHEEQEANKVMEAEGREDEKTEKEWRKAQKTMKVARAANAKANELALKAAKGAEEATAQMEQADKAMAAAEKTYYFVEPLLDEAQKYQYKHPDSAAKAGGDDNQSAGAEGEAWGAWRNSSDGVSNSTTPRTLVMRSTKQDPVSSRASLGVAAFLVAAPLLACSATVVGRVFGQTVKGSRVRPTDGDDADGTSALLQDPQETPRTTSPRGTSPCGSGSVPPSPRASVPPTLRAVQQEDTMSDSLSV